MEFKNELVLSLVQPYLTNVSDHVRSQLVSKYLNETGREDPTRPLPPLGASLHKARKKKDQERMEKYSDKLGVKQVYMEKELPQIHEALSKLKNFDVLGVNSSTEYLQNHTFSCGVECGVYIPVLYPRQKKPIWSLIYAGKKHTFEDAKVFKEDLEKLKIYGKFHGGLTDIVIRSSQMLIQRPEIKDNPQYMLFLSEANSPCPFSWRNTTAYYRWDDIHSNKKQRVTYG